MPQTPKNAPEFRRFLKPQERMYARALSELRAGKKKSCWIWYLFPCLRGLKASRKSQVFGLSGLEEARAYLAHPLLGTRLKFCCHALLLHRDKPIREILEHRDAEKLRASMTLFALADETFTLAKEILDVFFEGRKDPNTLLFLAIRSTTDKKGDLL